MCLIIIKTVYFGKEINRQMEQNWQSLNKRVLAFNKHGIKYSISLRIKEFINRFYYISAQWMTFFQIRYYQDLISSITRIREFLELSFNIEKRKL